MLTFRGEQGGVLVLQSIPLNKAKDKHEPEKRNKADSDREPSIANEVGRLLDSLRGKLISMHQIGPSRIFPG